MKNEKLKNLARAIMEDAYIIALESWMKTEFGLRMLFIYPMKILICIGFQCRTPDTRER